MKMNYFGKKCKGFLPPGERGEVQKPIPVSKCLKISILFYKSTFTPTRKNGI